MRKRDDNYNVTRRVSDRWLISTVVALSCCFPTMTSTTRADDFIPVPDRRDHVYDAKREVLYISTTTGTIERYDMCTGTFLSPFQVGFSLNGIDLTPECSSLLVAEGTPGNASGVLLEVDPETGAIDEHRYLFDPMAEAGTWDICIAGNGKALMTTQYAGSGWVPLREFDLQTEEFTIRDDAPGSGTDGKVRQDTHILRGADRSLLFLAESNLSSGPIFTYDAKTDSFPASDRTGNSNSTVMSSVNRDGSLIAYEIVTRIRLVDSELNTVSELSGLEGGMIFDPIRDVLYAADEDSDDVIAYDTITLTELFRLPVRADVRRSRPFEHGQMSITPDGRTLFLSVDGGIQRIELRPAFKLKMLPNPLVIGEQAGIQIRNGEADSLTWLVYSWSGTGISFIPQLHVYLNIDRPRLALSGFRTDAEGSYSRRLIMPDIGAGQTIWFQAVQFGQKTNLIETAIVK